jgi:hypothetical protein
MATATQALVDGGYRQITEGLSEWSTSSTRLFEDEYNIVGVSVFETTEDLLKSWSDRQGSLVEVISQHVGESDDKSWDGYLVLLTPHYSPSDDPSIEEVRYNTTRVRKLVAVGENLSTPADVESVLRPLLPLRVETIATSTESALELLPQLLATQGVAPEITRSLVDAFRDQRPLLEALHRRAGGS